MPLSAILTVNSVVEYGGNRRKIAMTVERPSAKDGIADADRVASADSADAYFIMTESAAETRFARGKSFKVEFADYVLPAIEPEPLGDDVVQEG